MSWEREREREMISELHFSEGTGPVVRGAHRMMRDLVSREPVANREHERMAESAWTENMPEQC